MRLTTALANAFEFACYTAACRPPRSGGTGGSSPKPGASAPAGPRAPRKTKAGSKGEQVSRFRETEFTKRIAGMIAEAGIGGTKDFVAKGDAEVAERRRDRAIRYVGEGLQRLATGGSMAYGLSLSVGYMNRDKMGPATLEIKKRLEEDGKRFMDPDYKPVDDIEAQIHKAVQGRLAWDFSKTYYGKVVVDGVEVSMNFEAQISGRQNPVSMRGFDQSDSEFTQAAIKVGRVIGNEIDARIAKAIESDRTPETIRETTAEIQALNGTSVSSYSWSVMPDGSIFLAKTLGHDAPNDPETMAKIKKIIQDKNLPIGASNDVRSYEINRESRVAQQVFLEVMEEVRPMGGVIAGTPAHRKPARGLSSNEQVTEASKFFPTDWIERSSGYSEISFKQTKGRAHYKHDGGETRGGEITLDGRVRTAAHELAHRFESTIPGVTQMESAFFESRTSGQPEQRLSSLVPGAGYGRNETSKPDDFFEPYAGKRYDSGHFELLSVGIEGAAFAAHRVQKNGLVVRMDPEYRAFVLGALATLYRP